MRNITVRAVRGAIRRPWWGIATIVLIVAAASFAIARMSAGGQATEDRAVRTPQVDAFRSIEPERLTHGVVRLDFALQPTFTPTPLPTATPVPPPPTEPVFVAGPSGLVAEEPAVCAASMTGKALALFDAMNAQRVNAGLRPLASDPCITFVAQTQADAMAADHTLSHETGGDAASILRSYGVGFGWSGENVARNSYRGGQTVSVTMQGFMASSGHRENILNPNFSSAGVGVAVDGSGMTYFAVVFVGN